MSTLERPPFDAPLLKMTPDVSPALKTQIENLVSQNNESDNSGNLSVNQSFVFF